MNIKAFSVLTGLSPYTLRYYERIGLLKNIQRNTSGHRTYTNKDTDWVKFILRLKETAMPLENILEYASLREQGDVTQSDRQYLLKEHRKNLKSYIQSQLEHLTALERKIEFYESQKVS